MEKKYYGIYRKGYSYWLDLYTTKDAANATLIDTNSDDKMPKEYICDIDGDFLSKDLKVNKIYELTIKEI